MLQTTIKDTNRTAFETLYSIRNVLAPEAMTALYCRLSVDDANDGDSNSIQMHCRRFKCTKNRKYHQQHTDHNNRIVPGQKDRRA